MSEIQIHPTAVVDHGAVLGKGTVIWHFCHVSEDSIIGENCSLGQNVYVAPKVVIGSGVRVQNNVSLFTGVTIEDNVFLGPSCVFTNVLNPRSFVSRKSEFKDTIVKEGASVGSNAVILCGHQIGRYALIGAGSVVTKDVKDFEVVVGNPARHHGWVSRFGNTLNFNTEGRAYCPDSRCNYQLLNGCVIESAETKE